MPSVTAYSTFLALVRVRVFLAGRRDFDFDADYDAYKAMANNDQKAVLRILRARLKAAGISQKQVKFTKVKSDEPKPEKVKGSYAWCKAAYDKANDAHCKRTFGSAEKRAVYFKENDTPIHLTHTTGSQGTKNKDGNLVAHYSSKRPRKVETPFGTEADNKEIF